MRPESRVGILGATSLVGQCLLSELAKVGTPVVAYSRDEQVSPPGDAIEWRCLPRSDSPGRRQPAVAEVSDGGIALWICAAPIWVLPEHFALLEAHPLQRVLALSSTSRFTKDDSSDPEENAVARRLADAEEALAEWAGRRGVEWVVLRPTLIYGLGRDKNLCEMARVIGRFGFFPLLGEAQGRRQPIHAQDVAAACLAALGAPAAANRAYNISGGSTLAYREMAAQVFAALGRPPRLLQVPLSVFGLAVALLRCLPRYRHWSAAMAERMNRDLVFDHGEAVRDFAFAPRPFALTSADLPK
ncbi:NAD-dependent epimerase/dehydratase family protein [Accumulibacter sp.]|uniref:NAD-dependent epimerase/dehydratase family protein n=1 Tax=Accumulibacter sp. TaxID=2053492 RepID=UPI00261A0D55|nr:NAD-dependent epimerase/dehydratase family protein [Accumulibacter sp.]